jgi:hypothetical protein
VLFILNGIRVQLWWESFLSNVAIKSKVRFFVAGWTGTTCLRIPARSSLVGEQPWHASEVKQEPNAHTIQCRSSSCQVGTKVGTPRLP